MANRPLDDTLTGRLLVASPRLQDGAFDRAVVFVLDHGAQGALGIILNRPMLAPVAEILSPWAEQAELAAPAVMFSGGPVAPSAVIGLGRSSDEGAGPGVDSPADPVRVARPVDAATEARLEEAGQSSWRPVIGGVGAIDLSTPPDEQPAPLHGVRLFSGYAGWGPDQLEDELEENAWIVLTALASDVMTRSPDALWHDVLRRQGGKLAMLASYPAKPSLN